VSQSDGTTDGYRTVRIRESSLLWIESEQRRRWEAEGKRTPISVLIEEYIESGKAKPRDSQSDLTARQREDLRLYVEFLRCKDMHKTQTVLRKMITEALRGWHDMHKAMSDE
jgi:hypothetical protein